MKSDNLVVKALSSKTVWLLGFIALVILFFVAYALFAKPCKGRVVDEITGEPIAGVVVVGAWSFSGPGSTHCLDAREVVSDSNGDFDLPIAVPADVFGTLRVAIYKVGYRAIQCQWEGLNHIGWCFVDKTAQWDGDRAVIPMKRVGKLRLVDEGDPPHISCGRHDGKPLSAWRSIQNEFRTTLGMTPFDFDN
jgi:hypothetical protein